MASLILLFIILQMSCKKLNVFFVFFNAGNDSAKENYGFYRNFECLIFSVSFRNYFRYTYGQGRK